MLGVHLVGKFIIQVAVGQVEAEIETGVLFCFIKSPSMFVFKGSTVQGAAPKAEKRFQMKAKTKKSTSVCRFPKAEQLLVPNPVLWAPPNLCSIHWGSAGLTTFMLKPLQASPNLPNLTKNSHLLSLYMILIRKQIINWCFKNPSHLFVAKLWFQDLFDSKLHSEDNQLSYF